MQRLSKARWLKFGVASAAYLPMLALVLAGALHLTVNNAIVTGCVIFNFPAISLIRLIQTFNLDPAIKVLSGIVLMFLWSSLVAWIFWRAVETFQGEDEAKDQHGKYDWIGFQVRFFIGFTIGFLVGWRFVRYSTSRRTLLIASIVSGIVGGFMFGISRPPDFWTRT